MLPPSNNFPPLNTFTLSKFLSVGEFCRPPPLKVPSGADRLPATTLHRAKAVNHKTYLEFSWLAG